MRLTTLKIQSEKDIPRLREVGQTLARNCGFPKFAETRIVTAFLELGRNVVQHGGGGKMVLSLPLRDGAVVLMADAIDQGPGIADLNGFLEGSRVNSGAGLGLGLRGVSRLADRFEVQTGPEGTHITASFDTPVAPEAHNDTIKSLTEALMRLESSDPAALLIQQNRDLLDALAERDLLMAEVHHRTKNNLSMVTALMRMSRASTSNEETHRVLRDVETRIRAIAAVHDRLQRSAASDRVLLMPLLETVAEQIRLAFNTDRCEVGIAVRGDRVELDGRAVTDIALAAGELMTNSIKHAFEGRSTGTIEIAVALDDSTLKVTVADDGVGLPAHVERPERSQSLGWTMIRNAVQKHGGFLRTTSDGGLAVEMTILAESVGARAQR